MFEELVQLVTQQAQDQIVKNDAIPNEHNEGAINEVAGAIKNGLAGQLGSGNLGGVMELFGGKGGDMASNPIVQNIVQSAAAGIASKFNVDPSKAQSIATSLIPQVMSHFTQQTADPNNSTFNMNQVVQSLGGGTAGGVDFNDLLGKVQSGSGIDVAGIAKQVMGGQSGGIGGLLSGFLK
ncbi:MAG: hypothetical protein U0T73_12580 [Chitinophagales bacterium]